MKKVTKGFTAIGVLLLFGAISGFLIISYSLLKDSLGNVNNYTDKTRAINNSIIGIEDAKSFFYNNKALFYDFNDMSPCDTIGSVSNYANYNINSFTLNETLHFKNSGDDIIGDENLKDDQGFLNRTCSIYTKGIPNKNKSDYSILGEPSTLGSDFIGQVDENGYYNISKIMDNKGFGYFFTSDQVGEDEISVKLDYNFEQFEGIDSLNIYDEDLKDKVLLLKKNDSGQEVTKSTLKTILTDSMYIYSDANLEIGIIEFDGDFNITDGFTIDKTSGNIMESIHKNGNNVIGTTRGRLLCDGVYKTCELNDVSLQNNKVYFIYLKSFEKPTTYHLEITNKIGDSIFIPSNNLSIKSYGISNGELFENNAVVDISKKGGYFSDFSSVIYNYVYFSKN